MPEPRLTPDELQTLLVTLLAGATGTPERRWKKAIRRVDVKSLAFSPRCNWQVEIAGTAKDRATVEKAVAIVQAEHPYARAP